MIITKDRVILIIMILLITFVQALSHGFFTDSNEFIFLTKLFIESPIIMSSQLIMFVVLIISFKGYLKSMFLNIELLNFVRQDRIYKVLIKYLLRLVVSLIIYLALHLVLYQLFCNIFGYSEGIIFFNNITFVELINYNLCILLYLLSSNLLLCLFRTHIFDVIIIAAIILENIRVISTNADFSIIPLWNANIIELPYLIIMIISLIVATYFFIKKGDKLNDY